MSDASRESAQLRKGKSPIIAKYSDDHKKLFSVIAGRGFLALPGYAYDAENNLELTAKLALSELNMKILGETIEREMKQTGIDYDLAYKTAALVWESDKQALIADWDKELAGIKKGMADSEEVLNQLEIAVNERGTYIIEQKTIIETAVEGYRLQLAQLDALTAPYEVSLAGQKLLTAQKKLELIPILEQIIVKEQELLAKEQEKATYYSQLIAAEREVADKKESVLQPAVLDLIDVSEQYTSELATQIELEGQISDEKIKQAEARLENIAERVIIAEQDSLIAEANLAEEEQKLLLQIARDGMENTLLTEEISNINELTLTETSSNATILGSEESTQAYVLDKKRTTADLENTIKKESNETLTDAQKNEIQAVTNSAIYTEQRIAEINAAATLTASLTHILG